MSEDTLEEVVPDPWTREQPNGRLDDGERVVAMASGPAFVLKKYRTRYVLTDRRLIRLQRNFFNVVPSKEFSLAHIATVSQEANPILVVEVEGSGDIEEKIILSRGEQSTEFIQELRKQVNRG